MSRRQKGLVRLIVFVALVLLPGGSLVAAIVLVARRLRDGRNLPRLKEKGER